MKNLGEMTLYELEVLIGDAMQEYRGRMQDAIAARADLPASHEIRDAIPERDPVRAPNSEDQAVVRDAVALLRAGKPIYADEVKAYRRIVGDYPDWAKRHKFPDDVRGAAARKFKR